MGWVMTLRNDLGICTHFNSAFAIGVLHQRKNLNPKNFVGEEHCEEHRQRPGV